MLSRLLTVLAFAALAGCSTIDRVNSTLYPVPEVSAQKMIEANNAPQAFKPADNGAIYQAAMYRPLLEDHRARLVGDIVTIAITEQLSATQTSTTAIAKTGAVTAGLTAIPYISPDWLSRRTAVGGSSSNTSSGKGQTQNVNSFTGTITATVISVLPNGHLLVRGEKQIGVNQNVDTLQFTGQVDPMTIAPGNVVQSTQVANVRIQQRGRGAQADAQGMGWLARFFLNLAPI